MFFRLPLPWTDGSFYFIFHIKYDYFFVPKVTCRSLVSVLIIYVGNTQQDLLSVGWYLNKGRHINILTSSSRGKFITAQKQGEGGTRADQAMCQHFQIWPPFVPRLLSLLPSTHLWNHVMIIRWKPIKKSNKREYIIIETPRPDYFQLCVCVTEKDAVIQQLIGKDENVFICLWHVKGVITAGIVSYVQFTIKMSFWSLVILDLLSKELVLVNINPWNM